MLFSHKTLLALRESTPKQLSPKQRKAFGRRALRIADGLTVAVPSDWTELLFDFLDDLPPARAMKKIVCRLATMAEERKATLKDFRWWDIVGRERTLLTTLRRKGKTITVAFFWKKTEKKAEKSKKIVKTFGYCSFVPDRKGADGRRLDVEGGTYQEMKAAFALWLDETFGRA